MARRTRHFAALLSLVVAATLLIPAPALAVPTWQPVTDVSAIGDDARDAQVAVDVSGNSTAVWTRGNGVDSVVQAASRAAGGVWSVPVNLSTPGQNAFSPQVALDRSGNATVVWSSDNGSYEYIQSASRSAGGSWTAPVDVSVGGMNATTPQVAVDDSGTATAVWVRSNGTHFIAQSATRAVGGIWTGLTDLSAVGAQAQAPQVAAGADGSVVAVWSRVEGAVSRIQASVRPPGGGWGAPATLSEAGQAAIEPVAAVDGSGNATAAWQRFDGSHFVAQASTRAAGGGWSSAVNLSAAGAPALQVDLAMNAAGAAAATWTRHDGSHPRVQASTRSPGQAWTIPLDLSVAGQPAEAPQIALDEAGTATAVWHRLNGSHYIVQSATRPANGDWSTPTDLSASGQSALFPQVAVDSGGNATAVWRRSNGSHFVAQARGLDGAGPVVSALTAPATGTTGQSLSWSVTASDVWSTVASVGWEFGDGTTAVGASVSHAYASAGTFPVTVTLTDAVGNVTTRTTSATITALVKPPVPTPSPPSVTTFKLKPAKIRAIGSSSRRPARTRVTIVLSAPAKVTLRFKGKTRAKVVKSLRAGRSTFKLDARIARKKLKPGRYVVSASTVTSTKRAKLKIVR